MWRERAETHDAPCGVAHSVESEVSLAEGQEVRVLLSTVGLKAIVAGISTTKYVLILHQL